MANEVEAECSTIGLGSFVLLAKVSYICERGLPQTVNGTGWALE